MIKITKKQLLEQFGGANGDIKFRKITNDDLKEILEILPKTFFRLKSWDARDILGYTLEYSDDDISFLAEIDGKIAGFFFIGKRQIPNVTNSSYLVPESGYDYEELSEMEGVEGVMMGVNPEFSKYNVGVKMLSHFHTTTDADYMWGEQLSELDNINFWKRRSELFFNSPSLKMTYKIFKK